MPGVAISENVQATMRHSARPQPALGKAIRQLREKSGETQEAIARRADIAIPTLSLIEGGNANPTWDTVKGIAAALGVSVGEMAKLSEKFED